MGYYICTGACIGCGRVFSFNPNKVPSSRAVTGRREPFCQDCVTRFNQIRANHGLEPIKVLPGAYEPASEDEW